MSFAVIAAAHDNNTLFSNDLACPVTSAGSLLLYAASYDASGGQISVVNMDAGFNAFTRIGSVLNAADNQYADLWYCENSIAGSVNLHTGLTNGGGNARAYCEITGVKLSGSLRDSDATKAAFNPPSTSADATFSNNILPTAGDLLVGALMGVHGVDPLVLAGSTFSLAVGDQGTGGQTGSAWLEQKVAGAGLQNTTWTVAQTNEVVVAMAAAFAPAAATSGQVLVPPNWPRVT